MDLMKYDYPIRSWMVLSEETHSRCEILARTRTEALIHGAELLGCPQLGVKVVAVGEWS